MPTLPVRGEEDYYYVFAEASGYSTLKSQVYLWRRPQALEVREATTPRGSRGGPRTRLWGPRLRKESLQGTEAELLQLPNSGHMPILQRKLPPLPPPPRERRLPWGREETGISGQKRPGETHPHSSYGFARERWSGGLDRASKGALPPTG